MAYISSSVSKLGKYVKSIGLLPEETCRPDAPCVKGCYGRKGRFNTTAVHNHLVDNTREWFEHPILFKRSVIEACMLTKYFRWFYTGDIVDRKFLSMMFSVANKVTDTKFLVFTKKYELVNVYLNKHKWPTNLCIVLSAWGDDFIPDNPHNLPMAFIRLPGKQCTIPAYAKECSGGCENCILSDGGCWDLQEGEAVVFNFH